MNLNNKSLEIISAVRRIQCLETSRTGLAEDVKTVEKPLLEAYKKLAAAFEETILAEAKYLASLSEP